MFGILVPALYLIVELGFNHQLANVSSETVNDEILSGLEFWGRIISGVGLGLILFRWTSRIGTSHYFRMIVCLALGMTAMWHIQRELTDYLVSSASVDDKKAAVVLSIVAKAASEEKLLTLENEPILSRPIKGFEKKTMMALFPAAALHADNREKQLNSWMVNNTAAVEPALVPKNVLENAYKNLIVPPIAIGLSTFFALFNLSQLISSVVDIWKKRIRPTVTIFSFACLVAVSLIPSNSFTSSAGYQNSLEPGLWRAKPLLAILVGWSMEAAPTWGALSSFSHRYALFGYSFKKPAL
ncbi:MAG: hypothetical protein FJX37_02390 [Alphaproteobacteria bacterium]|nr:hypothetical protein [Alphaproteobacteria bacterium]MBM3952377.1 hypothetical protein [Rhodospirillales bacterium]